MCVCVFMLRVLIWSLLAKLVGDGRDLSSCALGVFLLFVGSSKACLCYVVCG